jgi:hypothetical protein
MWDSKNKNFVDGRYNIWRRVLGQKFLNLV